MTPWCCYVSDSDDEEEREANYERYRILVQNECAGGGY